jgi:hypothetical protein
MQITALVIIDLFLGLQAASYSSLYKEADPIYVRCVFPLPAMPPAAPFGFYFGVPITGVYWFDNRPSARTLIVMAHPKVPFLRRFADCGLLVPPWAFPNGPRVAPP